MRLPFFGSKDPDKPIHLPLPETLTFGYGVYFKLAAPAVPTAEQMRGVVLRWLDAHAGEPLRSALKELISRGLLSLEAGGRNMLPPPPVELLRLLNPGEAEERCFREATHLVIISAPDILRYPHAGFWAAAAAARAIAQAAKGVILDPDIPRLLSFETHAARLPADARIRLSEHTFVPTSVDERGLAWITTKGLGRFGFPELEIRDAPPNIEKMLWPVMNGMSYYLLRSAVNLADERGETVRELPLGPEVRLTLDDLARAEGQEPDASPAEGVRGWTDLRLEYHPAKGRDSFLRIVPPRAVKARQGEWLHAMLNDLFGAEDTLTHIPASDEAMEIAHRRAVDELPQARARFLAGLPPGATLYVKQAFETRQGHPEFMWLAVNTWKGSRIQAQLANDPQYRLDLRAGQSLELDEGQVYDWMISWSDGRMEGGYTVEVLRQRGG